MAGLDRAIMDRAGTIVNPGAGMIVDAAGTAVLPPPPCSLAQLFGESIHDLAMETWLVTQLCPLKLAKTSGPEERAALVV